MLFPEQPYTRYRFRTVDAGSVSYAYNYTLYNGTVSDPWKVTSVTPYSGTVTHKVSETMHDCETPDWLKEWSSGLATVNPMEQTQKTYYRGIGNLYYRRISRSGTAPNYYYTGHQGQGTAPMGDSPTTSNWAYPSSLPVDDSVIAEAITEAWSKVSLSDTMVLATAWELDKTLSFIISVLRRAWKIFRAIRKLQIKAVLGEFHPAELAQRYMEARYALRPMAYDIRNTLSALIDKSYAKVTTFRGFTVGLSEATTPNFVCRVVASDYRLTGTAHATRSMVVRSGVLTTIADLNAFHRWGSADIIQTAWEIIPFSFIVDWFCQVGKLLSAWSPKVGIKTLASWYVVDDTTTLSVTAETGESLVTGANFQNIYTCTGTYSMVDRVKYRVPNPDRPILPSFNVKLNKLKLLDLGIIAAGISKAWFGKKPYKGRPKSNYGYAWIDGGKTPIYRD